MATQPPITDPIEPTADRRESTADPIEPTADRREPTEVAALHACMLCGTRSAGPPLTWMLERTTRGSVWYCGACARANLRAVEAKLDEQWW